MTKVRLGLIGCGRIGQVRGETAEIAYRSVLLSFMPRRLQRR